LKYLLDTQLLLWWLNDDSGLSPRAREVIANPGNMIYVSAVTLWEIRLKQSLGKLALPPSFDKAVETEAFEPLPLTPAHTSGLASLPWHHRDPFDRMLLAQAVSEGLTLLTADRALAAYGSGVELAV